MTPVAKRSVVTASLILGLAVAFPSPSHAKGSGKGAPSRSKLPTPSATAGPSGATPFAWMDDASLVAPATVWLGISTMRWQGAGLTEVNAPIVDLAIGVAPRLQFGASVPRVVGSSDPSGPAGGIGTTYLNAKIGLAQDDRTGFKLAVAPTIEVLSAGAVDLGENRTQWGLPLSAELERGIGRVYASAGFFSRGIRFIGAGGGMQFTPKFAGTLSLSRAWTTQPSIDPTVPMAARNEVSFGSSYSLTSNVGVFGSVSRTIATTDENGAGTSLSIGMSFMLGPIRITE
jgi:hypothetical protein